MDIEQTVTRLVGDQDDLISAISDIIDVMSRQHARIAHIEGHLGEISKRPAVVVKPNSRAFLLGACLLSGYFGYKLSDRRVRDKLRRNYEEAVRRVEENLSNVQNNKPANGSAFN